MTERPDFLSGSIGETISCSRVQRACPSVHYRAAGWGYLPAGWRPSRQAPGAIPVAFLKARLKAASES